MSNLFIAMSLQEAARDAVYAPEVRMIAEDILTNYQDIEIDQLQAMLFGLVAMTSSCAVALTTDVLMSPADFDEMMNQVQEMEDLGL